VLLAAALLGAVSCGGDEKDSQQPPVVLIIIDTLRADHLSCYGYELETSPVLDGFARGAFVFEANSTQCNSTFPSITSILTGQYPRTHRNYLPVPLPGMTSDDRRYATLAERAAAAGYHAIAAVSHPAWRGDPEIDGAVRRGFEAYSVIPDEIPVADRPLAAHSGFTNERAFALLDRYESEEQKRPLLLWVHYFDPHTDLEPQVYNPPEAYWNRYLRHHLAALGDARLDDSFYAELASRSPQDRTLWIHDNVEDEHRRSRILLASGRALYDAEIAYCDSEIGRLFERLRTMGLYDPALIVVMADHGENLELEPAGQGRLPFTHRRLYEPVVHTPLMIKLPHQVEGARIDALSQNIDVLPTIVELLGLHPEPPVEGRSLVPLLEGSAEAVHELVIMESSDHVERAVRTPQEKYIAPGEDSRPMLFRWTEDPHERTDLSEQTPPEVLARFASILKAFAPSDTYCIRLVPESQPYSVELQLELASTTIESTTGPPGGELSADRHRFTQALDVERESIELRFTLERRNTLARWRIARTGSAPVYRSVRLGQLPISATTAIPILRAGSGEARPAAAFAISTTPGEIDVEVSEGSSAVLELRYQHPQYGQSFELLEAGGFGPLMADRAVQKTSADKLPARARLRHEGPYEEILLLLRLGATWPELERGSLNGHALALNPLEFVIPYPLDPRLVGAMLAGPSSDPAPGSIEIWLESGQGAMEIDRDALDPELRQNLEDLGYIDAEEPSGPPTRGSTNGRSPSGEGQRPK
jgi:arylsulfatase